MDVMTAKMRAFKFKQNRLKRDKNNKTIPSRITALADEIPSAPLQNESKKYNSDNIPNFIYGNISKQNLKLNDITEIPKRELKQKNIQLRIDQIKSLREYTFKSGDLNGVQLNESQITRVALDIFFWLNINPSTVETEEELLTLAKKSLKSIL